VNDLNAWLPWIAVAISAASLAYTILTGRSKKYDERLKAIEEKHKYDHDALSLKVGTVVAAAELLQDRVIVIENDMKHLPDKEVTHRLERAILEMRGEVGRLTEQVRPISHMASRMQDAMMEKLVG
jgi:hypothetical protein